MAYERIEAPKGSLYHYTKKERLDAILRDGRIRRFKDRECWFCTSLADTLRLMEMTVMKKGFRGDLKFYQNPQVLAVAPLLEEQTPGMDMTMRL